MLHVYLEMAFTFPLSIDLAGRAAVEKVDIDGDETAHGPGVHAGTAVHAD